MAKSNVVATRTEMVRVIMEWTVPATVEDTEGNGVKVVGWLANASELLAQCDPKDVQKLTITRLEE